MSKTAKHYLADGTPYSGPTHKNGKEVMTGAKHDADSKPLMHAPKTKPKKLSK